MKEIMSFAVEELSKRADYFPSSPNPITEEQIIAGHRNIGRVLIGILSIGLMISSVILGWELIPGKIQNPLWAIAVLFGIGTLSLVWVVRHKPGTYWLCIFLSFLMVGPVIVIHLSVQYLQKVSSEFIFALIFVAFSPLIYFLISAVTASKDLVPLSSPLSRLVYFGRYAHLMKLNNMATSNGWKILEPAGLSQTLVVQGFRNGRDLTIVSGKKQPTKKDISAYFLKISLSSRKNIWSFLIDRNGFILDPKVLASSSKDVIQISPKVSLKFYLWPQPSLLTESSIADLKNEIIQGRGFLFPKSTIISNPEELSYLLYFSVTSLSNQQIQQITNWLDKILILMENSELSLL